jgi:hypothetical protein
VFAKLALEMVHYTSVDFSLHTDSTAIAPVRTFASAAGVSPAVFYTRYAPTYCELLSAPPCSCDGTLKIAALQPRPCRASEETAGALTADLCKLNPGSCSSSTAPVFATWAPKQSSVRSSHQTSASLISPNISVCELL